ncbi:MAG: hypothetical protein IR527_02280 [Bacteroides sp.]|nr:MAG: hypothetical protein IR527_02280 [Bacteroides sp.]
MFYKIFIYFITLYFLNYEIVAHSQCAMCNMAAESSFQERSGLSSGLNIGILYIFLIPYIAIFCIYIIWKLYYRKI